MATSKATASTPLAPTGNTTAQKSSSKATASKSAGKAKSGSSNSTRSMKENLLGKQPAPTKQAVPPKKPDTGISSSAEDEVRKLRAQIESMRISQAANARPSQSFTGIPRPSKGIAGNGFNLQHVMGLKHNRRGYLAIARCVRDLGQRAGIDPQTKWRSQPKTLIAKVIAAARERHPFLGRFQHGWPVEEMLKTQLKNRRAYLASLSAPEMDIDTEIEDIEMGPGEDISEGDVNIEDDGGTEADDEAGAEGIAED